MGHALLNFPRRVEDRKDSKEDIQEGVFFHSPYRTATADPSAIKKHPEQPLIGGQKAEPFAASALDALRICDVI